MMECYSAFRKEILPFATCMNLWYVSSEISQAQKGSDTA
jgi:hypothetical protein